MTDVAKRLLEVLLALPEDDQRWITDRLLERVPRRSEEEIDAAWRDVAIARTEELTRGEGETVDGDDAVREIEDELRAMPAESMGA